MRSLVINLTFGPAAALTMLCKMPLVVNPFRVTEHKKEDMMEIIIIIIALVALNIAVWWWGFDSTDSIDSPEWERRRNW